MGFAGQLFDKPGEGKYTKDYLRNLQKTSSSSVKEEVKGTNVDTTKADNKTERPTRNTRRADQIKGVKQVMGYPLARGPGEETGDALVIKCVKYVPPETGLEVSKSRAYAGKDGVFDGRPTKAGQLLQIENKETGELEDLQVVDRVRIKNNGASDQQKNAQAIYYITLPIPQDINDSNVVTWGEDNMNIFQIAAVDAAAGLLDDFAGSFQTAKSLLDAGIGRQIGDTLTNPDGTGKKDTAKAITRAIAGEAIDKLGGNIRPNSVLGRSTGMILNSNLELLFSGVTLRTFPFSINFSPRNSDEAKEVISIIKALKSSMAAKKNASQGQGGIFLRAPDVFQLRYLWRGKDHPFLNRIKDCALTAMTVNYTNSGTYATYDDGTPVSIRMNLTFKELNPIYFEDYEDYNGPGVGY